MDKAIKEKIERLSSIPDKFSSGVKKAQYGIFSEIQDLVDQLERDGDSFAMSKKNLVLVSDIETKLKDILYKSEYVKHVKGFIDEFSKQAEISKSYFDKAFDEVKVSDVTNQILKNAQRNSLNKLVGDGLTSNFITPAKDILDRAISTGAGWKETVKALQDFALGDGETDGKLFRYSKQIASDAFAVADRSYTNALSLELESEWFLYSGDVIADSREFCNKRHDKYFHKREVEAWAEKDWPGKMAGTDASTIFSNCGGYNCKHSLLPVSVFSVPKDVLLRNRDNGNWKPSEFEKKELGV